MRIGYVLYTYPAISQSFVLREIAELRRLGWDVHTWSLHETAPADLLDEEMRREEARTPALLPVRPLPALRAELRALRRPCRWASSLRRALAEAEPGLRGRLRGLGTHAVAAELSAGLSRHGVRHVHVHFAGAPAHVASLACELRPGRTWSATVHGPAEFFDQTRYRLAERVAEARFTAGVSHVGVAQLRALVEPDRWDDLHLVRCGVDVDRFVPPPRAPHEGPVRLLCVARLAAVKGHTVLLDALAELRRRGVAAELTLVGDGPLRGELERRVAALGLTEAVTFRGSLSPDEVRARYAEADVFCLPSFAEGVPVVLMEALAMELAVVATQVGGVADLVQDGRTGLVVAPADASALAEAIARLAADPELGARLGRAGRAHVAAEFGRDRGAQDLHRLLSGVVR